MKLHRQSLPMLYTSRAAEGSRDWGGGRNSRRHLLSGSIAVGKHARPRAEVSGGLV